MNNFNQPPLYPEETHSTAVNHTVHWLQTCRTVLQQRLSRWDHLITRPPRAILSHIAPFATRTSAPPHHSGLSLHMDVLVYIYICTCIYPVYISPRSLRSTKSAQVNFLYLFLCTCAWFPTCMFPSLSLFLLLIFRRCVRILDLHCLRSATISFYTVQWQ